MNASLPITTMHKERLENAQKSSGKKSLEMFAENGFEQFVIDGSSRTPSASNLILASRVADRADAPLRLSASGNI